MAPDTATASESTEGEVVAAVDGTPRKLVIADISRDEAWVAMQFDDTVCVQNQT